MTGRVAWLVIGVVATVVTLASAGTGVWLLTSYRPEYHSQFQAEAYAENARSLSIQLDSGSISVHQGRPGQVRIVRQLRWTSGKPVITEHWRGQQLDVTTSCSSFQFGGTCLVNYTIAVPPGVSINAVTGNGTVSADDMSGQLDLTSYSGDVTVTGARSAQVIASSDSGNVRLGFAAPPSYVQATTDSGNVTIEVPPGSYSVKPTADSGNTAVTVDDDPASPRSIKAASDSGNVTVTSG
jgi:hypothetical protein